jgi:tetratricopeptide (TPR) repeat protein
MPADARNNLTACLSVRDDFYWLHILCGLASVQMEQYQAAETDFQRALRLQPDAQAQYGILVNLGYLRLRQAQMVERLLPLSISPPFALNVEILLVAAQINRQERLADASRWLRDAIALKPNKYPAYRYLAMVHQQEKQLDEAIEALGLAIKAAESQRRIRAQLLGQRARLYRDQNKIDDAIADLRESLRLFPSAADHVELGRIVHAKSYSEAVKNYKAAIALQPNETSAYRLMADALMNLEKHAEAAQALDQYIAKNGRRTADVFRTRGRARALLHRIPEAQADYTQALALQPDSATHADRGLIYLANDSLALALQDFTAALELNPRNAKACAGRALAQARQGKHIDALSDVEKAINLSAKDPAVLWEAAHVFAQLAADAAMPKSKPVRTRISYQEEGVDLLRQSLERVPKDKLKKFWDERIDKNSLLDPLRNSPGFDRLERDYGKSKGRIF